MTFIKARVTSIVMTYIFRCLCWYWHSSHYDNISIGVETCIHNNYNTHIVIRGHWYLMIIHLMWLSVGKIPISLMKQQFVVTHTIRQTEIPALLDSWVTNAPSVKMLQPQKNCFSLYFHRNIACLSVSLRICQVFPVSCKIVYWWVTTNCCFMIDIWKFQL
jgi:hypothetical protein